MQAGPQHAIRTTQRRGFTLMEMLLVLGVLVVALAMVYPALMRLAQDQNLLHASEVVQTKLSTARVRAARDGMTYQFRFEPNGRKFVVIPETEIGTAGNGSAANAPQSPPPYRYSGEISAGLQFDPGQWTTKGGTRLPPNSFDGLDDARFLEAVAWSSPVLFYPDGTGTDGELIVFDTRNCEVRFTIRGLTSAVSVSQIKQGAKK